MDKNIFDLQKVSELEKTIMHRKNIRKKAVYQLTKLLANALKHYDISDYKARGYMFQTMFLYARAIDDYADGDIILDDSLSPLELQKRTLDFLDRKLDFIKSHSEGFSPCDELDELIGLSLDISDYLNIPLDEHLEKLFVTFNFDCKRRLLASGDQLHLYNQDELIFNSFEMFLQSCYLPLLQVIGSPDEELDKIRKLCYANRIYYNAQDLPGDLREGMVNISLEDFESFGIKESDLYYIKGLSSKEFADDPAIMREGVSEGMWQWFQSYVNDGYDCLSSYEDDSAVNSPLQLVENFATKDNLQDAVFYISLQHGTKGYFKNLSL